MGTLWKPRLRALGGVVGAMGLWLLLGIAIHAVPQALVPTEVTVRLDALAAVSLSDGDQPPLVERLGADGAHCSLLRDNGVPSRLAVIHYTCSGVATHSVWLLSVPTAGIDEVISDGWRAALLAAYPASDVHFLSTDVTPSESDSPLPEVVMDLLSVIVALLSMGLIRGAFGEVARVPWRGVGVAALVSVAFVLLEGAVLSMFATPAELRSLEAHTALFTSRGLWLAMLTVVLAGPLFEEVIFRGSGWAILARKISVPVVWLLTSLIFALLHGFTTPLVFGLYVASGLLYGALRWRYQSIWPALAAHAVNNLIAVTFFFVSK